MTSIPAAYSRPPRIPACLIVLVLVVSGIELGVHQLPGAGLLICAAAAVAATHD